MTSPPTLTSTRIDQPERSTSDQEPPPNWLAGQRIALIGRLGSMTRREATTLIGRLGGTVVRPDANEVDCLVIGADAWPLDAWDAIPARFHEDVATGRLAAIPETEFWQRLGILDSDADIRRLYTPAMLADLLTLSVTTIRSWARRGLITPVREIHRLPYFDFQEVVTARRLAELLNAGMSASAIAAKLQRLAELLPGIDRPLAQLSIIVDGRDFLLRTGSGLIDSSGQRMLEFSTPVESVAVEPAEDSESVLPFPTVHPLAVSDEAAERAEVSSDLVARAFAFEEAGQWDEAIEAYRLAMLSGEPSSEMQFALAELLYRRGDLAAARERYYCAIELDHDFVEARANLGCVLTEEGQTMLAMAAYQGAIARYPDYADAHYQLARLLDQINDAKAAEYHWREFARLAPTSPWADEACDRLGLLRS